MTPLRPTGGIQAPETVPEGSTGPVTIKAPNTKRVIITNINSGEEIERDVTSAGTAQFELPPNWVDGDVITIVDKDDPTRSASVEVSPASTS